MFRARRHRPAFAQPLLDAAAILLQHNMLTTRTRRSPPGLPCRGGFNPSIALLARGANIVGVLLDSLAELLRRGADHVVAYAIGFVSCLLIWGLWLRPAHRRRRALEQALHQSKLDAARNEARLETLEAEAPALRQQVQNWQAKAESERKEAGYYSNQVMLLQRQIAELKDRLQQATAQTEELTRRLQTVQQASEAASAEFRRQQAHDAATLEQLSDKLEKYKAERSELQQALEKAKADQRNLQWRIDELTAQAEDESTQRSKVQLQLDQAIQQRDEAQNLLEKITQLDGNAWRARPEGEVPAFRPLVHGAAPIVAVVNLKGGVGKTTLTANLAATWFRSGKRVLAIDLDYQNSLTHLCLPHSTAMDLRRRQHGIEHLLADPDATAADLVKAAEQIDGSLGQIVATSESLTDVESDILTRWLLRQTDDDVRFRLRRLLHEEQVQKEYDYILLDCPPRLSAACINALACADFVLVPVLLDALSSDAVPRLLGWLRMLKHNAGLCPELRVLGLVANKVRYYRGNLVSAQQPVWDNLPGRCVGPWGEAVHRFTATIPLSSQFGVAANNHEFAADGSDVSPHFLDLAQEISQRIRLYEGGPTPVLSR